eukprot:409663_1
MARHIMHLLCKGSRLPPKKPLMKQRKLQLIYHHGQLRQYMSEEIIDYTSANQQHAIHKQIYHFISIRKRFISRINYIYNIALNRYSSDKQLRLLSFDFAKRYSERISRGKFLKALLLHPHILDRCMDRSCKI